MICWVCMFGHFSQQKNSAAKKNWAIVSGGNGKWKRKMEMESGNWKRSSTLTITHSTSSFPPHSCYSHSCIDQYLPDPCYKPLALAQASSLCSIVLFNVWMDLTLALSVSSRQPTLARDKSWKLLHLDLIVMIMIQFPRIGDPELDIRETSSCMVEVLYF